MGWWKDFWAAYTDWGVEVYHHLNPFDTPSVLPYDAILAPESRHALVCLWNDPKKPRPGTDWMRDQLRGLNCQVMTCLEEARGIYFEIEPQSQLAAKKVYDLVASAGGAAVLYDGSFYKGWFMPEWKKDVTESGEELADAAGKGARAAFDLAEYWWVPVALVGLLLVIWLVWAIAAAAPARPRRKAA